MALFVLLESSNNLALKRETAFGSREHSRLAWFRAEVFEKQMQRPKVGFSHSIVTLGQGERIEKQLTDYYRITFLLRVKTYRLVPDGLRNLTTVSSEGQEIHSFGV